MLDMLIEQSMIVFVLAIHCKVGRGCPTPSRIGISTWRSQLRMAAKISNKTKYLFYKSLSIPLHPKGIKYLLSFASMKIKSTDHP